MSAPLKDRLSPHSATLPGLPRRPRARVVLGALLAVCALALVGCGDDGAEGSDAGSSGGGATADLPEVADSEYEDMTGQDAVEIDVRDNTFGPEFVTVSAGTEVTFGNRGRAPHNAIGVEEGSFPDVPTDELQPGDEATRTFDEPGDYPYYCTLHGTPTKGMTGRIRVEAAS